MTGDTHNQIAPTDANPGHPAHEHHRHGADRVQPASAAHGGHAGHHGHELDWAALGAELERDAELSLDGLDAAIGWIRETLDAPAHAKGRVLDVGSGPGVAACRLARHFPAAEVVAVDGTPDLLARAQRRAAEQGLADRLTTRLADLSHDVPDLGPANLVWTSQTIHHLGDQGAALGALGRSLRPGGVLAVAEGGLPPRFLPRDIGLGRPGLLARVEAAREEAFTAMRAQLPDQRRVVEDWPTMLAEAGLTPTGSRTFLTELRPPLAPWVREHLRGRLARTRHQLADHLGPDDLTTLDRLADPDASDGLLRRPDVFYLAASTVHTARARPA